MGATTGDFNKYYKSAFIIASETGNIGVMDVLLRHGADINVREYVSNHTSYTSLHIACQSGNLPVINFLLAHGANPNMLNEEGLSPFMIAYRSRNMDVISLLLKYEVNLNALSETYNRFQYLTPLMHACLVGDTEMVKILLEHGAEVTITNHEGKTALDYVGNNAELSALLHHQSLKQA